MSGNSAGKVYFVLYLAVVLELLIIIVERDEAEEHLHKKQKEAMKIVESILSQLQAGGGTEGINTRPQDEITIPPSGVNLKEVIGADVKSNRRYIIEVGVTDVAVGAAQKENEEEKEYLERLEKLVKLANVEEIEYQIFFSDNQDPDNPPPFPNDKYIRSQGWNFSSMNQGEKIFSEEGEKWEFVGLRKLTMDLEHSFEKVNKKDVDHDPMHPTYGEPLLIGGNYAPKGISEDSIFAYSIEETMKARIGTSGSDEGLLKRAFVLEFEPPGKSGWYKLRIYSRTNRILGLRAEVNVEEIDHEATVNIGTVQLKVEELDKVRAQLEIELDRFKLPMQTLLMEDGGTDKFDEAIQVSISVAKEEGEEDFLRIASSIQLYGYIVRLLTPGKSVYFPQNSSSIVYDIRVLTPKPPIADPIIAVNSEMHNFDDGDVNFRFSIAPYRDGQNTLIGEVFNEVEGTVGQPVAKVQFTPVSDIAPASGGSRDYYGKLDRKLMSGENGIPRRYLVKLSHKLMAKQDDSVSVLTIYPSLIEKEVNKMKNRFKAMARYGRNLIFNFIPPSGRNILPEQFGYYFKTDADAQDRGLTPGFTAERKDNLVFTADAKSASLRIVWTDPITGEELEVFPEATFEIKQASPKIQTGRMQTDIAGDERLKVLVSSLGFTRADIGGSDENQKSDVVVTAEIEKVKVVGYKATGKPKVQVTEDNFKLSFDLVGEPDEDGRVRGTVKIKLTAIATNPLNGSVSKPVSRSITVKISKKVETEEDYYDE
jgi:hypothetical protein